MPVCDTMEPDLIEREDEKYDERGDLDDFFPITGPDEKGLKVVFEILNMASSNVGQVVAGKDKITITDSVDVTFDHKYLIVQNDAVIGYAENSTQALNVLNTLSNNEIRKLNEKKNVKIFRRDVKDGTEIHVCLQTIGLIWNSKLKKVHVFTTLPVPVGVCH